MMHSRGPNGRYVRPQGGESRVGNRVNSDGEASPPSWIRTQQSPTQDVEASDAVSQSCPADRSDDSGHSGDELPSRSESLAGRSRRSSRSKQVRFDHAVEPGFVGESWYASYVMRGFAPGHADFHRSIDECNETLQKASRDVQKQSTAKTTSRPCQDDPDFPDLPPRSLMDRLIDAYFDRFHTFCPIINKSSFLSSIRDGSVSATLLRSVLFVASIHCDLQILHLMGHGTRWDANEHLFTKASTSFDADRGSDRTNMVLSSYLLHYWFGSPTTYRDSHWWLAAAIRSAQCMGYHRSTKNSTMPAKEKSRWKRIWWCLYVSSQPPLKQGNS